MPVARADADPGERLGRAYFPAVGALVGLAAGVVFMLGAAVLTPLIAAVAAVATLAVLTGGLHLDGLADAADGLFGAGTRERRLEVMRDPRLGSFGAIALVLVLIGDVAALSAMAPAHAIAALIAAGALSRLALLAAVAFVPYARSEGLGIAVLGGHRLLDLAVGCLVTVVACLLDIRGALLAGVLVALSTLLMIGLARRRIGGATGDIYGACTEIGQLAALLAFVAA
jgi:adenosylcobinamide-GDP ribazoletransferase